MNKKIIFWTLIFIAGVYFGIDVAGIVSNLKLNNQLTIGMLWHALWRYLLIAVIFLIIVAITVEILFGRKKCKKK